MCILHAIGQFVNLYEILFLQKPKDELNDTEVYNRLRLLKMQSEPLEDFMKQKNLTEIRNASTFQFNDRYAFIMVKRKANNTIVKQEQIVLTLTALLSRIGGLCSIYIGLNLAFVIELIEFVYLVLCGTDGSTRSTSSCPEQALKNNGMAMDSRNCASDDEYHNSNLKSSCKTDRIIHNRRTDDLGQHALECEEEEITALTWGNSYITSYEADQKDIWVRHKCNKQASHPL